MILSILGFDRHGVLLSTFSTNSDFGGHLWPKFVYESYTEILDDEECSYLCTVVEGPCNLFYFDQAELTCYVGRFSYSSGSLLTNQSDPFYQIQASYGKHLFCVGKCFTCCFLHDL